MSGTTSPVVTVVCPTYNRGPALEATLRSALDQSLRELEVVVVADGCTDDTVDVVRRLSRADRRLRVVETTEPYGHPAKPRNLGAALGAGDLVAYLDHDDVWRADHLARAVRLVENGADVVASGYEHVVEDGTVTARSNVLELFWHPEIQELGPLFEPSRVLLRRGVLDGVGGWRPGVGLEDWDLWLRLADAGRRFATHVERTVRLLQHGASRRHATSRPHRFTLGRFAAAPAASACARTLRSSAVQVQLDEAAVDDIRQWYARLEGSGALVTPQGHDGGVEAALSATPRSDVRSLFDGLVVLQRRDGFDLALPLWSATGEGADRVRRRLAAVHAGQMRLITDVVTEAGGVPCAGPGNSPRPVVAAS